LQIPPEQKLPEAQSESEPQLPTQACGPHRYVAQPCVWRAGHPPAPSHAASSVATPDAQLAPRQMVSAAGYAHAVALDPSHVPAQAVPSLAQAWRAPWGVPTTSVQTPKEPGTSHAWHWPPQALVQQTPSMH
jgi:hypothetical protein